MLYSKHRGNGRMYEYFCCIGHSTRRQGWSCPKPARRLSGVLNKTFFTRILVSDEGRIDSAELTPVYDALAA